MFKRRDRNRRARWDVIDDQSFGIEHINGKYQVGFQEDSSLLGKIERIGCF